MVKGAEKIAAKRTGTVWDAVSATQSLYPGTVIPRSFELAVSNNRIWVHGNATEHLAEYATSMLNRGVSRNLVNLASQQQLRSLQAAVQSAIANGIPYGRLINLGGWELKFAVARAADQLPALIHALPR
ncbi:MAG: hemagglutinin [Planctomycetota bacterium]|nr:MAG: hemagglutinin [Planctomycetota bacterium]